MFKLSLKSLCAGLGLAAASFAAQAAPVTVYGAWLCSNDACGWSAVRDMTDFDAKNRWLVDRGDGRPSVNVVVFSFVNPLKLLNKTNDAATVNGIPKGMTQAVVNYFKSKNVRVMLSIGGITYTNDWNTALATNPTQLGLNAAEIAQALGVGIEIDYEESSSPNLDGLQKFVDAYRSRLPYDPTGNNHAARLTIDLGPGDRWLSAITRKATADWLGPNPVLDYANAMVPAKQPSSSSAIANWQEHIDGKPQYAPPIPPLAPARFTGSLYITSGNRPIPECNNFSSSVTSATGNYVQTVAPNGAGTSPGMLGYMFWAAECPSTRNICTTPPNSCEKGVGVGATTFNIPVPMPPITRY